MISRPRPRSPRPRQVAALLVSPAVDLDALNGALWAADALAVLPYALAPVSRPSSRIAHLVSPLRNIAVSSAGAGSSRVGEYRP